MSKIKLIVEVDEELHNAVKGSECEFAESLTAIAHGTPIDKGDLIMYNLLMTTIADKGLPFEEVLLLIDNAPTVESEPKAPESEDK